MKKEKKPYKPGTYFAVGLSIGIVCGIIFHHLWFIAIGAGIGFILEQREKKKNNQDTK